MKFIIYHIVDNIGTIDKNIGPLKQIWTLLTCKIETVNSEKTITGFVNRKLLNYPDSYIIDM